MSLIDKTALPGATIDENGRITIPAGTPAGSYRLRYQICRKDAPTLCDDAWVTVTVKDDAVTPPTPQPQAPTATNDPYSGAESGQPFTTPDSVLVNDSVPTADPATIQLVAGTGESLSPDGKTLQIPNKGTWQVNPDGSMSFVPVAGYADAPPAVDYTYSTADGSSGAATVTVTQGGTGPVAPKAVDDTFSGTPGEVFDMPRSVLENDPNPDATNATPEGIRLQVGDTGGTLSVDGRTLEIAGKGVWTVDPVTGRMRFAPAAGYTGLPPDVFYTYRSAAGKTSNPARVRVTGPLHAEADTVSINTPPTAPVQTPSVFDKDLIDGVPPTATTVTVSLIDKTALPGATIDENGLITIPAGTPAGSYRLQYQICRKDAPTLCDDAWVTVTIGGGVPQPQAPVAIDDTPAPVQSSPTAPVQTPSVFGGDSVDGVPPTAATVTVSLIDKTALPGATIDENGRITLPAGTPAGSYRLHYQICRKDVPALCDDAWVTVTTVGGGSVVQPPPPQQPRARNDLYEDGVPGQSYTTGSVLTNDPDAQGATPGSIRLQIPQGGVGTLSNDGRLLTIPNVGTWQVNADGSFTFTPVQGYKGLPPSVDYTYEKNGVRSNVATVSVGGGGQVVPIPTLGHLGMALLAVLLGGMGMLRQRRRQA